MVDRGWCLGFVMAGVQPLRPGPEGLHNPEAG